ncbi:MAG: DUF885 domain-containing protein [Anaerolineales bacterium]|nr:DUF885 domain-containing protein [Anaerolineales bacterium]
MNKMLSFICMIIIIMALVLGGCSSKPEPVSATPSSPTSTVETATTKTEIQDIDSFFNQTYFTLWGRDPETVTILGLASVFSQNNDQLTDISDEYIRETQSLEKETLAQLNEYDWASLTADQQMTYDVFKWYLEDRIRSHEFMYNDYPVNVTVFSVHTSLLDLFTEYQPMETAKDAQAFIARLTQVDQKMTQLVDGLNRREEAGVILPKFLLSWVNQEINQIAYNDARSTPYYQTFEAKLDDISGVSETEKEQLLTEAADAVTSSVLPGYQKLADCLNGQLAKATNDGGVWKFPKGEGYYAYILRHYTTTTLSADEIHALGLEQLERIHAEMRVIFDQLGYPQEADLPTLFEKVAQDSGMASGDEMVGIFEGLIEGTEPFLDQAFDIRPRADVIVQGVDYGGYYMPPAVDGSRPGIFYATLSGSEPKFNMPSLLYHETIPGHHFQIAIAQELDLLPLRRTMDFTAYAEGWALYAERLMSELGAYEDNPYGDLGRLQYEAFRAARLVVDTGIHVKKWDYNRALEFMVQNSGLSQDQMQYEVSRYMSIPGQSTAYEVGLMQFLALRQKAQEALGDRFDLKEFHNAVLLNGAVPLEVLEVLVDNYIQETLSG